MNELESEIQEVETSIENVRKTIARMEKLERLQDTPEWKELITEGYLRDEAARITRLKGDLQMRMAGDVQMTWLDDMLTGIGAFYQYIYFIRQTGLAAKNDLENLQGTQAELLREQMGGTQ